MKKAIRDYLLADTALGAAVTGVYSYPAPATAAFPFLLLSRISCVPFVETADDIGTTDYDEEWQIDVHAQTDLSAEAVKELVVSRMRIDVPAAMGAERVHFCRFDSENQMAEDMEPDGSRSPRFVKSLNFTLQRQR